MLQYMVSCVYICTMLHLDYSSVRFCDIMGAAHDLRYSECRQGQHLSVSALHVIFPLGQQVLLATLLPPLFNGSLFFLYVPDCCSMG